MKKKFEYLCTFKKNCKFSSFTWKSSRLWDSFSSKNKLKTLFFQPDFFSKPLKINHGIYLRKIMWDWPESVRKFRFIFVLMRLWVNFSHGFHTLSAVFLQSIMAVKNTLFSWLCKFHALGFSHNVVWQLVFLEFINGDLETRKIDFTGKLDLENSLQAV